MFYYFFMGEIRHILTSPPFRRQAVFIQFPWGSIFCKWSSRLKGFKWEALTIWSNSSYEAVCFAALNFASFRTQYKLSEAMSAFKLSSSLEISIASRRRKKIEFGYPSIFFDGKTHYAIPAVQASFGHKTTISRNENDVTICEKFFKIVNIEREWSMGFWSSHRSSEEPLMIKMW